MNNGDPEFEITLEEIKEVLQAAEDYYNQSTFLTNAEEIL